MNIKVVITGKTGYLSNSLSAYLSKHGISNETVSVRRFNSLPDFTGATAVIHCAGIVHTKAQKKEYYSVNTELTVKLAEKAKAEGVRHFVFVSTASVYHAGFSTNVTHKTVTKPLNDYGKSKLLAEKRLKALSCNNFSIAIVRLPMVYGTNCSGNFSSLYKLAEKSPFFPYVNNNRTMLYIDNFTEFMRLLLISGDSGLFFPQNREYVNTSILFADIRRRLRKRTLYLNLTGKLLTFLGRQLNFELLNKVFGSFTYAKEISNHFDCKYCVSTYQESIAKTCHGYTESRR